MQRQQLIGIFLIFFVIASAPVATQAQKPSSLRRPSSNGTNEIGRTRDQFLDAVRSKRLDEICLLFAPDASMVPGGAGRVAGRAAIRDLWEKVLAQFTSDATLTSVHMERSGDLGYDTGDFEETSVSLSDGKRRHIKGTYLMVFRREPGGSWQIVEQVWTERTQPPAK